MSKIENIARRDHYETIYYKTIHTKNIFEFEYLSVNKNM